MAVNGNPQSLESAKGADARRQTGEELARPSGGALDAEPVLREFLQSAKGTDAHRQTGEELARPSGGAPDAEPVLREFPQRQNRRVFITGGTGYMGSRLIPVLLDRGHRTVALTRESSKHKLPPRSDFVIGDALNGSTYSSAVEGADTFIHLVGVSHPSPAKAREFVDIDLKAALESIRAARAAAVSHFVCVSVAHPAPVMKAYIDVRIKCEEAIADSGLNATILRPWYVLGPGHRWPYALIPFYKAAELLPSTREGAIRLGLVTIREMVGALLYAAENPAHGQRVLEPKDIRKVHAG